MFYLKLYSLQRLHILGQYFSIRSLFVRHVPFVQVVPHFGLKFLHSPVKSLSMTVRAICSLRPFFPIDLLFILTAKILVAPTLAASALCAWSSRRVGLLSYHVTTAKMIKKNMLDNNCKLVFSKETNSGPGDSIQTFYQSL